MTATPAAEQPPALAPARPRDPRRWLILGVICLAQLVVILDNTILNVAVPTLTDDLGATTADIQWIINAYVLVQAGLLLAAGAAADRYGRRRLLLAGLAVFGAGSLAAGLAHSTAQLIAARAGMGVGGALLLTTTLAVAVQVFDEDERVRAIGIWAAVNALGFAAGPLVGGVLLDHFWWGALFLVNLPVVVLGLCAVAVLVPESRAEQSHRPDLPGALLSTVAMTALVYAVVSGPEHGWSSAQVLLGAVVGACALAAFVAWERHFPHPMLDMSFFSNRTFTGAVFGALLITFGSGGALFLLTQQLQFVLGYGPLEAGLRTAPFALTVVLLNFTGISARFSTRLGIPGAVALGMTLLACGLAAVAVAGRLVDGYGGLLAGLVLMGVGCAFANPAMAVAVLGSMPREKAGAGAGIEGTVTEFGSGLGVAVLGAVLSARFSALVPVTAASLPAALAAADSGAERATVTRAFGSALETGQLVGAAAVLIGGLVAATLLRRAERGAAPVAVPVTDPA
ncbi:MFS transporter [Streptomyces kunmingensis]|uniref:MFS transporter n=1 Tax=Streptomyces kunmingensis TaxID=68225 RepID=A0ABU6CHZ4_9ACTN|nr:MFS transporter [Streptomyces kunmingensis]MEB3964328.1 MFS transporter [Streptomyces kunmingensis]